MAKKNILLHVHIFKNAGSSFDDALKRFYGDHFVDHRDDADLVKGKMAYLEKYLDSHPEIQAFSSHSVHFLPQDTDKYKILPVYFLRHPIDRIRSVYSFEKKQMPAITHGSKKAKEVSFNDYISWYMQETSPATIRNAQTIFLSGDGPAPSRMQEKFTVALKNVNTSPLVGIVDRYDESMVVFEEYLKAFFPKIDLSYIRKNVTDENIEASVEEKANKLLAKLDEATQALVKEKNAFDTKLYITANIQLDAKISGIENFEQKLNDFKERCVLKLVHAKANKGDFKGVVELLAPMVKNNAKSMHIYLALANAKKELKQYNHALGIYETIIKKFPNNPWAYFHEAEMYSLLGKKKKSEELFALYSNKFQNEKNLISIFLNKIEK